jgi:hypothetical protein
MKENKKRVVKELTEEKAKKEGGLSLEPINKFPDDLTFS